jgi:hypothetical protein
MAGNTRTLSFEGSSSGAAFTCPRGLVYVLELCEVPLDDALCSSMARSIIFRTACHAFAPLFSRSRRDICSALRARCRSGVSKSGFRSSDKTCMMAWNEAIPPAEVNMSSNTRSTGSKPICHWKRAACTSAAAPLIVSMQLTDFSKILWAEMISDLVCYSSI